MNSSCFLRRKSRPEKGHGLLGKTWEISVRFTCAWCVCVCVVEVGLHVPGVCVGVLGLVEGGSKWRGRMGTPSQSHSYWKHFENLLQYLPIVGIIQYLNKTRITCSLVGITEKTLGLNLHLPHFTFQISDSLRLGTIPYSVCHPIPLRSPSTVLPGFQFWLTSLKGNHWHQAWHTMFALDVYWTATWASGWTAAHDHRQSQWSTSRVLCWFSTSRGEASCCPTKGTLAWKLGYLDSSPFSATHWLCDLGQVT